MVTLGEAHYHTIKWMLLDLGEDHYLNNNKLVHYYSFDGGWTDEDKNMSPKNGIPEIEMLYRKEMLNTIK